MKKLLGILVAAIMLIAVAPLVTATGIGGDIGIVITPEQFEPRVFMDPCSRVVYDDPNEPGAESNPILIERVENYAFEGEQVVWKVLVWDKNGKEKISDVHVNLQQAGQDAYIEANCVRDDTKANLNSSCQTPADLGIYEGEEHIIWNGDTMRWYTCTFTVETPASMHGQFKVVAEAEDVSGKFGESAESEIWFFNPTIALGISGNLDFGTVRPGGVYKSSTLTIGNAAEAGSGVMLDMYIAGTDFFDPAHSGAMCPTSNVLKLTNFKYYASNGAYNTCKNTAVKNGAAAADAECYVGIPYYMTGAGSGANNNMNRIIDGDVITLGGYPAGNVLSPGAEISINFKLNMPVPCNGASFSDGEINIFGEAV